MPRFTLDISDPALAGLQLLVARYNADNGTALAVQDWLCCTCGSWRSRTG